MEALHLPCNSNACRAETRRHHTQLPLHPVSCPHCSPGDLTCKSCRWLGNPTEALQEQSVLCWNTSSIFVVITDNCPCIQTNVTTGEVNGVNPPCCGDVYHM